MLAVIAVLEFEPGGRDPAVVRIVPVDNTLIAKTLKRIRREEARGNRAINRITVPIPFDGAISIDVDGKGLLAALMQIQGSDASRYIVEKIEFRRTCGFDENSIVGTFLVPGIDAHQKIESVLLGRNQELEVQNLRIARRRFDIPLDIDTDFFESAVLETNLPPLTKAFLEFEDCSTADWINIPADLYVLPPSFSATSRAQIRIANKYLEVILDFEKEHCGFTMQYKADLRLDFHEMVELLSLGSILSRSICQVTVVIKESRLSLRLGSETGPFSHWTFAVPTLQRMSAALRREHNRLVPDSLFGAFQDWVDGNTNLLALGSVPGAHLTFPSSEGDHVLDEQRVLLAPLALAFADFVYHALVAIPIAEVLRTGEDVTVVGGEPSIEDDIVLSPGTNPTPFIDRAIARSIRKPHIKAPAGIAGSIET
jgi:hypothetical protein